MSDLRDQLQRTLGTDFTLERELGGGGMSRVFVARDTTLDREVVIKVLPPELAADVSVERFKREIALAARLQHAHIVPLLSADESDGLPFYMMPFVAGESLRVRLARQGALPVSEAVRLLREVASALAYAHESGLVHRDIKPDNVLLSGGAAMVTDFGIAKAVSNSQASDRSTITSVGMMMGTPAYMAPEQAAGDPAVDHRADLYAFGVLAYEVLSGQTPFGSRPLQALIVAHITEAPEPLASRQPSVPPVLSALVMRCLEKLPDDRPQSAKDIVHALDDYTTPVGATMALPSVGVPVTGAQRAVAWQPRTRLLAMIAVGVLFVGGPAAWLAFRPKPDARPDRIAILPLEDKTGDADRNIADGITREIIAALTNDGEALIGYRSVQQLTAANAPLEKIAGDLKVDGVGVGQLIRRGDSLEVFVELWNPDTKVNYRTFKQAVPAAAISSLAGAMAREIRQWLHPTPADSAPPVLVAARTTSSPAAYAAFLRGQAALESYSKVGLKRGIAEFEQAIALDPTFAPAHAGLGQVLLDQVDYGEAAAEQNVPRAAAAIRRALVLDTTLGTAHLANALLLWRPSDDRLPDDNWRAAGVEYARALKLQPSARAHELYGWFLECAFRYDEAVAMLEKAVQLDPASALMHSDLAWRLLTSGQTTRAAEEARLAIAIDSTYAEAYLPLSEIALISGQPAEAKKYLDRYETLYGGIGDAMYRNRVEAANGRPDSAKAMLARLLRPDSKHPSRRRYVAVLHAVLGNRPAALTMLEEATAAGDYWNPRWTEFAMLVDEPRLKALAAKLVPPR